MKVKRSSPDPHLILCLLFIYLQIGIVSGKRLARRHITTEAIAWTGQELALKCDDDLPHINRRFWRKGYELIAAANLLISMDERIHVINNSRELRIANITSADEGQYTCVVNTKPQYQHTYVLRVRELVCESPEVPEHGAYENQSVSEDGTFRFGNQVRYYCYKGYSVIGDGISTCADPYKGWTPEAPTCQLEFLVNIKYRLDGLENKINHHQPSQKTDVSALESKMSNIEERVTLLEGGTNFSSQNQYRIDNVDATLHRLRTAINTNIHRSRWEKLLHGDLANLAEKDGYIIAEFIWFVENIEEKIAQHRAEKFPYLESKPFYTNIPGHRMQIHLYPDYDQSGYLGVYAILVDGEFDGQIPWPFTNRYELSIVSRDENDVPYDVIIPSKVPTCNFEKPPPNNKVGCGFGQFLSIDTLLSKKHLYLYDGGIALKIMVYLNYT